MCEFCLRVWAGEGEGYREMVGATGRELWIRMGDWDRWVKLTGSGLLIRIDDINKSCLEQFRAHWECLDNNNQQMWHCRPQEWKLNGCVFDKLV